VLDLGLPDMDGVGVIRGLRGWTPVPIIVLSGRAGSSDKVAALDAGADDSVTKPSASTNSSPATPASWSANATCCSRCGARSTRKARRRPWLEG
jgi:CheY-like chemotaxis protein